MAKGKKLKEDTIYHSGQKPKFSILNSSFVQRMNSINGFRTLGDNQQPMNQIEKDYRIRFVRVDLANSAYKFHNAALGSVFQSKELSGNLEKYFDSWLNEMSLSYEDIQDRQMRMNKLKYMCDNDVFVSRCVQLVADEATQLDVQDRLISIESPNNNFVEKVYTLLNRWGITQNVINETCFNIELYGEAFWSHKVGLNGIERIQPLDPHVIMERLEFNPMEMARYLAERDGWQSANKDRASKLAKLVQTLNSAKSLDEAENLSDMFDTKLFGYELQDGLIAPPWLITHFRFNPGANEFRPYGRPPLIFCLAPFQQSHSTMVLQGLARMMSFPITVFSVKNTDGLLPDQAFELVSTVKEQYDNLGVSPTSAGSEIYTVNTKMWIPEGLVEVSTVKSDCDYDYIGDLENYQDRVAIAAGVPKAYLDQEFGGFGNSAISLTEQYKPFARHVYTVQSTFLQGLGELIRMHFAITGEFDYNTPFILSMRFPAEEVSDDKRNAQTATIEMSQSIIALIKEVLGIGEEDPLPEDVVVDILSKYSFLDPTEIQKWMRLSSFLKSNSASGGGDEGGGDMDFDMGDDSGPDDSMGDADMMPESIINKMSVEQYKDYLNKKEILRERKQRQLEAKKNRLREVSTNYRNLKEDIYMRFVESNHLQEWKSHRGHEMYVPPIYENHLCYDSFKLLSDDVKAGAKNPQGYDRIKEAEEIMNGIKLIGAKKEEPSSVNKRKIKEMLDSFKN